MFYANSALGVAMNRSIVEIDSSEMPNVTSVKRE